MKLAQHLFGLPIRPHTCFVHKIPALFNFLLKGRYFPLASFHRLNQIDNGLIFLFTFLDRIMIALVSTLEGIIVVLEEGVSDQKSFF